VHARVAIVYNEPSFSRYNVVGEERAVFSVLEAVKAVHQALSELDFSIVEVPLVMPMEQARRKLKALHVDLVFNLFEGFPGYPETEVIVPEILSEIGIPFTGCTGPVLRLCLDKAETKLVLKDAGIKTPDFQLLNPETLDMFRLGYPCIVKPRCEDASSGLSAQSVVYDFPALKRQVVMISASYGGDALVEKFIDGREFNATVLGNSEFTVLPVSEIVYSLPAGMPKILTFAAKWEPDNLYFSGTTAVCPADLVAEEHKHITEMVKTVYRLLGCRGYARIDMRMDREGQLNVLELNPNPDVSPDAGAARQARAAGMTYTQFIKKIVELALEKK